MQISTILRDTYDNVSSTTLPRAKSYRPSVFFLLGDNLFISYRDGIFCLFTSGRTLAIQRGLFIEDYTARTPLLYLGYFPRGACVSGVSERARHREKERRKNPPSPGDFDNRRRTAARESLKVNGHRSRTPLQTNVWQDEQRRWSLIQMTGNTTAARPIDRASNNAVRPLARTSGNGR